MNINKLWIWIIISVCFANPAHAEVLEIPLYKLAPVDTIDLKCVTAQHSVSISVPERWNIKKAVVSFNYVNSASLLKERSRLTVKMNGYPLAQIELSPIVPEGDAKVEIPPILLDPGYNDLNFTVVQHYTYDCEGPCEAELWTTLNLKEASLYIEYDLKPVPLRLSAVSDFIFDPKIFPYGAVNIITEDMSPEMITAATIIASGISLRFDYRDVVFSMTRDIRPDYDNILIGGREFIEGFLKEKGVDIKKISGPLLKIMHLPVRQKTEAREQKIEDTDADTGTELDRAHALIIVSGVDYDHVKLAAETLAIMSFPYPDIDEMIPIKFSMPDVSLYSGRLVITADKKYTFKTLNFDTYTFKGLGPNPQDITFRLPPDFLVRQNQYADLSLHFAYGAGMRSDSVLNIMLNGKHIRAIRLDNSYGAIIEGYNVTIPTYLFRPGANTLRFAPVLIPPVTNNCELVMIDQLFLTIFGNSIFYFPPMPHLVELPQLELFFLNGFPITRWPDGHESLIYLPKPDLKAIASALNIIGSITQKNGYPLLQLKVGFEIPQDWEGEILAFGKIADIPEDFRELAPLKLAKKTEVPYPIMRSWEGERSLAFSGQISGPGKGKGYVMQFQSPYKNGRSVILLTAASSKDLNVLSQALLEPVVDSKCIGDMSIIDLTPPDYNVSALKIGEKYYSGKGGEVSILTDYLYSLSEYYLYIVIALILFLGLTIFYLLNKHRKRRLKREKDAET